MQKLDFYAVKNAQKIIVHGIPRYQKLFFGRFMGQNTSYTVHKYEFFMNMIQVGKYI